MKWNWITHWAGVVLLGAALASGCENPRPQPVTRSYSYPSRYIVARPPVQQVAPSPVQPPAPAVASPVETAPETVLAAKAEGAPVEETAVKEEPASDRRSFNDITAHPCFGHAEDYQWLRGQLQYSHISKSWRLRYASVDESDKYGGSVTLIADQGLDNLKDSQYVQVRGKIIEAEGRNSAPGYQVDAFQPVENKQ